MDIEIGQVISQLLAFLIMFWILKRYAWKPLTRFMEERRQLIQSEFDSIANQKNEIKEIIEDYKEKLADIDSRARLKNQEEIAKGSKIAQSIKDEAQKQAKAIIALAQEETERELIKAKQELKKYIVDLVIDTSQKVIQEKITDEGKQKELIEKILTQAKTK